MVSILIISSKLLSILSQTYTLPTLQDDLTVLQHHPYQIQRLETSHLAKRVDPIAIVYWDTNGVIRVIFNMELNLGLVQIFERSGTNMASSILSDCQRWMQNPSSPAGPLLVGAHWVAQLGQYWRHIFNQPHGLTTIGITISLQPQHAMFVGVVLHILQQWLSNGGNYIAIVQVPDARFAGYMSGKQVIDGGSVIGEPASGDAGTSRFCKSPIQNSPAMFVRGAFDKLLRQPTITC